MANVTVHQMSQLEGFAWTMCSMFFSLVGIVTNCKRNVSISNWVTFCSHHPLLVLLVQITPKRGGLLFYRSLSCGWSLCYTRANTVALVRVHTACGAWVSCWRSIVPHNAHANYRKSSEQSVREHCTVSWQVDTMKEETQVNEVRFIADAPPSGFHSNITQATIRRSRFESV